MLPSCAPPGRRIPARRQRTFRSLLKRRLYIIGIGEEKTLEISTQYDIIEKIEISMPCKLMLARRSFFSLRHRRGRKNSVQTTLDELGFLLAYPLQIFVVGPFCRFVFYGCMGARTHIFAEG